MREDKLKNLLTYGRAQELEERELELELLELLLLLLLPNLVMLTDSKKIVSRFFLKFKMKKCDLEFNSSPPCFQLIRKDQKESKKDPEFHFKFSLPGRSGRRPLRPETETVGVEVRSLFSANWFLTCDSDSYDAEHGRYGWRQGSLRPQILRITLFCSAGDKSSLLCFDLRIYLLTF